MVNVNIYKVDCFDILPQIPRKTVSAIIVDMPYGTTACKWDSILDLKKLWPLLTPLLVDKAAIVCFCGQPFTSTLISEYKKYYRHSWVWNKKSAANFASAKYGPLKTTEDIVVFGRAGINYYPKMVKGAMRKKGGRKKDLETIYGAGDAQLTDSVYSDQYHPKNILSFSNASHSGKIHPTQKPIDLLEYLVETYSREGETVLDFTMGSASTGIAGLNKNRKFIGIEKDPKIFRKARKRLREHTELNAE